MQYKLRAAALAAITAYSCGAHAADTAPSIYTFSGFGTLGAAHSSEGKADFTAPSFRPNGPGHSHDWSTEIDSRLAGQLSATFDSHWSAVVQVIAEQQWDNSYRPTLEWANVQFAPTREFSVRVGRISLASFLMSNSRKVGYTLPWVRTPSTFYEVLSMTSSDGVDMSYRAQIGKFKNTLTLFDGQKDFKPAVGKMAGKQSKVRQRYGFIDTLEHGAATVQLSHTKSKITVGTFPEASFSVDAIAANYDPGNWFLTSELSRSSSSLTGDLVNWYVGGGYRINDFTPYMLVSERRLTSNTPASLSPPQKSAAIGLRWDVMKNTDIKLQYDRISLGANSSGTLINLQPGYVRGGKYHVVSATADFVF